MQCAVHASESMIVLDLSIGAKATALVKVWLCIFVWCSCFRAYIRVVKDIFHDMMRRFGWRYGSLINIMISIVQTELLSRLLRTTKYCTSLLETYIIGLWFYMSTCLRVYVYTFLVSLIIYRSHSKHNKMIWGFGCHHSRYPFQTTSILQQQHLLIRCMWIWRWQ